MKLIGFFFAALDDPAAAFDSMKRMTSMQRTIALPLPLPFDFGGFFVPGRTCGHVWRGFAEVGLGASAGFSRQSCAQLRQASCEAASHHLAPPPSRCAETPRRISPQGPPMYLLCQLWPRQDSGWPSWWPYPRRYRDLAHLKSANRLLDKVATASTIPMNMMEPIADLTTVWLGEKRAAPLWLATLGRPRQGLPSLRSRDRRNAVNVTRKKFAGGRSS
ncbi:hypothetical protein B0H14DRAFT_3124530 [Mycena olivaceomarginata]|nr:hypothetical protein B0H14DRAFT_3124530 [Mycena olivaceomarginata]